MIAAIGFMVYLSYSIMATNDNVNKLDNAQNIQYPLLNVSKDVIAKLETITLTLGDAVALSEEDKLNQAYEFKIYYHTLEFFGLCTACQPSNSWPCLENNYDLAHQAILLHL